MKTSSLFILLFAIFAFIDPSSCDAEQNGLNLAEANRISSIVKAGEKWCDQCVCTKSIPPQCSCRDLKAFCYQACERCACTKSIPPQCRCSDVKDYC